MPGTRVLHSGASKAIWLLTSAPMSGQKQTHAAELRSCAAQRCGAFQHALRGSQHAQTSSQQVPIAPAERQAARPLPAPLHPASAAPRHQSVHRCCPARARWCFPHAGAQATASPARRRAPVCGLLQRHQQPWQALNPQYPLRACAARCRCMHTLAAPHQRAGGPAAALLSAPYRRFFERAAARVMQPPG